MKKGKPLSVVIVDDDDQSRKTLQELLNTFLGVKSRGFDNLFDAVECPSVDLLLIDVSAVAPMMLGDFCHAWSPISNFANRHPGAEIVIITAASANSVDDLIDDCVTQGGMERARLHRAGFMWETIEPKLKELLNEN